MVKKIQINLSNRLHYTLILIGILIVGAWVVVAYGGAYGDPAIMGHTADEIDGLPSGSSSGGGMSFGTRVDRSINNVYTASTDLLVVVSAYCQNGQGLAGYADLNNPPTARQARIYSVQSPENYGEYSFTMPVKQGENWEIRPFGAGGNPTAIEIYEIPLTGGSGSGGGGTSFGDWVSETSGSHLAATDGIVVAYNINIANIEGFTDSNSNPTTVRTRIHTSDDNAAITMPVKSGDYWRVTGASTIYWIPLTGGGSGASRFGGMYRDDGTSSPTCIDVNPQTGACSCPTGFTPYMSGQTNTASHDIFLCQN